MPACFLMIKVIPWFQHVVLCHISRRIYISHAASLLLPSDHHGDETINVVQPWMTIGHLGPQFQLGNNIQSITNRSITTLKFLTYEQFIGKSV